MSRREFSDDERAAFGLPPASFRSALTDPDVATMDEPVFLDGVLNFPAARFGFAVDAPVGGGSIQRGLFHMRSPFSDLGLVVPLSPDVLRQLARSFTMAADLIEQGARDEAQAVIDRAGGKS